MSSKAKGFKFGCYSLYHLYHLSNKTMRNKGMLHVMDCDGFLQHCCSFPMGTLCKRLLMHCHSPSGTVQRHMKRCYRWCRQLRLNAGGTIVSADIITVGTCDFIHVLCYLTPFPRALTPALPPLTPLSTWKAAERRRKGPPQIYFQETCSERIPQKRRVAIVISTS